jgi:hypothetical protein
MVMVWSEFWMLLMVMNGLIDISWLRYLFKSGYDEAIIPLRRGGTWD